MEPHNASAHPTEYPIECSLKSRDQTSMEIICCRRTICISSSLVVAVGVLPMTLISGVFRENAGLSDCEYLPRISVTLEITFSGKLMGLNESEVSGYLPSIHPHILEHTHTSLVPHSFQSFEHIVINHTTQNQLTYLPNLL